MYAKTPKEMAEELNSAGYKDAAALIIHLCRQTNELVQQKERLVKLLQKNG
jgi:methionyl-tRNA synthetase